MTSVPDLSRSEVSILNAKRYGLTETDLNRFSQMMMDKREGQDQTPKTDRETDLEQGERIKDYVMERITGRMKSMYSPEDSPKSAEDLMFDLMSPNDKSSTDWSGLLNMHFDLDTLELLNNS